MPIIARNIKRCSWQCMLLGKHQEMFAKQHAAKLIHIYSGPVSKHSCEAVHNCGHDFACGSHGGQASPQLVHQLEALACLNGHHSCRHAHSCG